MSNVPLMFQPLVKYVDFQGRARRSEFWLWVLFRFILGVACSTFLFSTIFNGINWADHNSEAFQNSLMNNYMHIVPFANILNLINLGLFLPSIAVGVRRLHDSNRSGFWMLMPVITTFVGIIIVIIYIVTLAVSASHGDGAMTSSQTTHTALQAMGAFAVIGIIILIVEIVMLIFFVADGTPGSNRFGDDPKGRGKAATSVF